jgi:uncharacterized membrane protein
VADQPLPAKAVRRIEESSTARKLSDAATRLTRGIVPDRDSVLRGGSLGHAVHPVLTDLPLGCFISATLLDLVGGPSSRSAATLLVGAGVASALPTAVTGYADWTTLAGGDRHVGTVHALVNVVALGLFAGSLTARIRGRHRSGAVLALAGAATSGAAGYLGGHLAMSRGTADRTRPS